MWAYNDSLSLEHHGIKGQRWGVRRFQNEDGSLTSAGKRRQRKKIKSEQAQIEKSEYKRLLKEYDVDGKSNAAYEYGQRHGLDLDDGGGGSQRAGRKYMSMWDEIEALDDKALYNAEKLAREAVVNKFGEQTIKEIEAMDKRIASGKAVAGALAMMIIPAATVIGLIATDPNIRK